MPDIIGRRVEIAPHFGRWMRGDRFATVVGSAGTSGVALLYVLKFDKSGDQVMFADTNFKPVH